MSSWLAPDTCGHCTVGTHSQFLFSPSWAGSFSRGRPSLGLEVREGGAVTTGELVGPVGRQHTSGLVHFELEIEDIINYSESEVFKEWIYKVGESTNFTNFYQFYWVNSQVHFKCGAYVSCKAVILFEYVVQIGRTNGIQINWTRSAKPNRRYIQWEKCRVQHAHAMCSFSIFVSNYSTSYKWADNMDW